MRLVSDYSELLQTSGVGLDSLYHLLPWFSAAVDIVQSYSTQVHAITCACIACSKLTTPACACHNVNKSHTYPQLNMQSSVCVV